MVPSLPKTMKQWVTDYTGVENLKQETVELPQPGEGEVLVKVHTVSINFRDVEGKDEPLPYIHNTGMPVNMCVNVC